MAAAGGCSFHRTDRGFVLSSQWSLEYTRVPWLSFYSGDRAPAGKDPAACRSSGQEMAANEAGRPAKPELLPWRSRLRGYRLGSRLFHGRDSAAEEKEPAEPAAAMVSPGDETPAPQDSSRVSAAIRPDVVVD